MAAAFQDFYNFADPLVRPTGFLMNHKKKTSQDVQRRALLVLGIVKHHKHNKTPVWVLKRLKWRFVFVAIPRQSIDIKKAP